MPAKASVLAPELERYYRFHSLIYDATRWTFLFGRQALLREARRLADPRAVLEVGCGTGHNLVRLNRAFPQARLVGVDVSEAMLRLARHKLDRHSARFTLLRQAYPAADGAGEPVDLIWFSYALSMFNPGWEAAIRAARNDLAPGGLIAVVDFHASRFRTFRGWMRINHVRMEGHLLELLRRQFEPLWCDIRSAYGGVWQYFTFIGCPRGGLNLPAEFAPAVPAASSPGAVRSL